MRRVLAAALVGTAVAVGGCGGGDDDGPATTTAARTAPPSTAPERPPSAVERLEVGRGAGSAVVFRPRGETRPPGVVFLHGWGATEPSVYGGWIRHLVAAGNEVIYPRYQTGPVQLPQAALPNVVLGVRRALRRAPVARGSLVFAGHSAGGAMAADLAATARREGLPPPRAVFAAYPGRRLPGIPLALPEADPARIPAGTEIVALAGARDDVVGTTTARRTVRRATRVAPRLRRYALVRDPAVSGHLGPLETTPAARRAFWAPLDRLIARARAR